MSDRRFSETAGRYTAMMGVAAYSLQTATYNYPDFTFAPSTAPESWAWRNVIPYELAFDLARSGLILSWQPTWALSNKDLLSVRASLGYTSGIVDSSEPNIHEDYGALGLGLGYSRRTDSATISSWGLAPTWDHKWNDPAVVDQDTLGGDVHVSFFKDRLRLGLGARDLNHPSDTWFLTVGLTDLPGLTYWLTR